MQDLILPNEEKGIFLPESPDPYDEGREKWSDDRNQEDLAYRIKDEDSQEAPF